VNTLGSGHSGVPLGGAGGTVGALFGWQMGGSCERGVPTANNRLQYWSISAALGCEFGGGVGAGLPPGILGTRLGVIVTVE
jgi:hypothetical protein